MEKLTLVSTVLKARTLPFRMNHARSAHLATFAMEERTRSTQQSSVSTMVKSARKASIVLLAPTLQLLAPSALTTLISELVASLNACSVLPTLSMIRLVKLAADLVVPTPTQLKVLQLASAMATSEPSLMLIPLADA